MGTGIAAALTDAVCAGFLIENGPGRNPAVMFLLAAAVTAILLWLAGNRLRTRAGLAGGAVLFLALIIYMNTAHPLTNETENGTFIFFVTGVVVSVLSFLLSRTRGGTLALYLIGMLVQCGSHFLRFPAAAWSFLVFLAAAAMLYLYRVYVRSLQEAKLGNVRITRYLGQSCAVCLAVALLAGGVFAGVVRPLDPPTQELKLIRVFEQMELFKVLGISTTQSVLDPELGSEEDPNATEDAENPGEEESDSIEEQQASEEEDSMDNRSQNALTSIRYEWLAKVFRWLLLLIPLAVAALYGIREMLHRKWLSRVQALSREDAVLNYYSFFYRRIQKAGLKKTGSSTLREYTADRRHDLETYGEGEATFEKLTAVYEKVLYGHATVSEEELGMFEAFYGGFFRKLRQEVGTLRYYLTAFRY